MLRKRLVLVYYFDSGTVCCLCTDCFVLKANCSMNLEENLNVGLRTLKDEGIFEAGCGYSSQ